MSNTLQVDLTEYVADNTDPIKIAAHALETKGDRGVTVSYSVGETEVIGVRLFVTPDGKVFLNVWPPADTPDQHYDEPLLIVMDSVDDAKARIAKGGGE